ncbi:MAG TPA: RNA methyltransferase [Opitutaceae bacterium]|jgi:TrmH family RNA methyltransferase|nr:RNA methyltransferase [Opitutaceae bacterium]
MLTKAEITKLRALDEKQYREAAGLFVVEGAKIIGELLALKYPLLEIYATEAWKNPASDSRVRAVSVEEMARISHFPKPSAVLAVGRIERATLVAGELNQGLTLALDRLQDAGNVGTLLRIADWFALDRVVMSPDCADLFSLKVMSASMGSFARVRVISTPLDQALAGLSVPVLGCDLAGSDVHLLPPMKDAVIVIGSEGQGLSASVQAFVSQRITIPRYGGAESLNAAVAAAIVCDNLRRPAR